jgi:purine-binding chemotaxis protein CheW
MKNNALSNEKIAQKQRLLVFLLESKQFGIELTKIKEITDLIPTTRLPGARSFVKGLGNLRGEIIPIISLRERLHMGGDEQGKQLIVVLGREMNFGLLIDRIHGIFSAESNGSKSMGSVFSQDIETAFLKGICRVNEKDVILLDCDKLIEYND